METGTEIEKIALDDGGRINQDIACVRCGYNLRSLDPNQVCPECGTPVGRSLQGDFLRFRDPDWVESLASGMNWIVAGIVCHILFTLLAIGIGAALSGSGPGFMNGPLFHLISAAGWLVSFVGYWKVTTPEPTGTEQDDNLTARKIARFGVTFQVICLPVTAMLGSLFARIPSAAIGMGICTWIINLVGYFALMIYARRMALRIPHAKLARNTRIVMWGLIIPGINVICSIWSLRLIDQYRKHLREAAAQARTSWATQLPD